MDGVLLDDSLFWFRAEDGVTQTRVLRFFNMSRRKIDYRAWLFLTAPDWRSRESTDPEKVEDGDPIRLSIEIDFHSLENVLGTLIISRYKLSSPELMTGCIRNFRLRFCEPTRTCPQKELKLTVRPID